MKTRDKILEAALDMYNLRGADKTSGRHVSDKLGISYGNLTYHFPKKDDIILGLYTKMQAELDEQFRNVRNEVYRFEFMLKSFRVLLEVFYKYKFFFLDFAQVNRQFKKIKEHNKLLFQDRMRICMDIAEFLVEKGYAREEKVKGHYRRLVHAMLIVFNSWIADSEFFTEGSKESKIDYYLELVYSMLRSSLTAEGLRVFNKVYETFKTDIVPATICSKR